MSTTELKELMGIIVFWTFISAISFIRFGPIEFGFRLLMLIPVMLAVVWAIVKINNKYQR